MNKEESEIKICNHGERFCTQCIKCIKEVCAEYDIKVNSQSKECKRDGQVVLCYCCCISCGTKLTPKIRDHQFCDMCYMGVCPVYRVDRYKSERLRCKDRKLLILKIINDLDDITRESCCLNDMTKRVCKLSNKLIEELK